MIDVFEQIKPLLTFESKDDTYFLQILSRKKDNPELKSNGRLIKSYFINSLEYLESRYDEIKRLCEFFNARASLRLNRRSYQQIALKTMELILKTGMNSDWEFARKAYDRAAGKGHADPNKTWIVDVDDCDSEAGLDSVRLSISNARPEGDKVVVVLPTKSGYHMITRPFDVQVFSKEFPDIDIHKDNPINLYIP